MKLLFRILYPFLFLGLGWIIGSKYKAPPIILDTADTFILATSDTIKTALREREAFVETILRNNTTLAELEKKQKVAIVEEDGEKLVKIETSSGGLASAPISKDERIVGSNEFAPFIRLCKMNNISNAPIVNSQGNVVKYKQITDVEGVSMGMAPLLDACISSGFGRRNGKHHKGYDYYNKNGGMVFAAGDGQIVEAEYRNDYGFTVLINHGNDYFTRYAHLKGFEKGVKVGAAVPRGFSLGEMGQTAGYKIPKHLHFELLKGDYNNPKKSFGLKPVDIFHFG